MDGEMINSKSFSF